MSIYFTGISNDQMTEINVAEHGNEWNGDVAAYLYNAFGEADIQIGIPGYIMQNFGGLKNVNDIHTVFDGDSPCEVWFAAEE